MKIAATIVLVAGLLVFAPVPSESQADLTKILVGEWEGNFVPLRGGQQQRVLVFESVHHQGEGWVATAKFGRSEESLFPVSVTLAVAGSEVRVKFRVAGSNEANLMLLGDKQLVGTLTIPTQGGRREVPMTLDKVK